MSAAGGQTSSIVGKNVRHTTKAPNVEDSSRRK
jgi:hypothetical protein